jgi:ribosome maturation factor RimP
LAFLPYLCEGNKIDEGNGGVPFFISRPMTTETKTIEIQKLIEELLEAEPQYFLVRVHVRPINNFSIYVDGDEGVTIDKCVKLNRALYKKIVETGLCEDGAFALEVSSPGVDEPLVLQRQYQKNVGRSLEVVLHEGTPLEGKLVQADEKGIELEEEKGKGKKKEVTIHFFLYEQIKSATVKITF